MAALSISRAWDETKGAIATDGRLMVGVAAALIVFPAIITGVISPSAAGGEASLWKGLVILIASLVAIIGQLSIIRLAVGPAVSVGEAIGHGARRMPIYFVAGLLLGIALAVAAIPFVAILFAAGVPLEDRALAESPLALVLLLLFLALVCFVGVRMLVSSPVASEESVGPIEILRRSWELTRGHWWRLFGFILLFLIGAAIAMAAVSWAVSFVAVLLLGPIEPMTASALLVAIVEAVVNAAVTVLLAVMLARIYVQLSGRESLDVTVPRTGT